MKTFALVGSTDFSLVNFRFELLEKLKQKYTTVYAFAPSFSPAISDRLKSHGIETISYNLNRVGTNPLVDIKTVVHLYKLFRQHKIDSALFYTPKPVIYGSIAAKFAGVRDINSMITGLGYAFTLDTFKAKIIKQIQKALYKSALFFNAKVIFQNQDDKNLFLEKRLVAANKTTIVNGSGVNLDKFSRSPIPSAPIFLMVARLIKEKGITEYVSAAKEIKNKHPNARFLLAGGLDAKSSGFTEKDLKLWQSDFGVDYLGNLSDVRQAIRMSSVFVLPSYREGTPRSVLEAMAMGRAIITTRAPGCRETVVENKNGYLVNVGSVSDLCEAMVKMIEEPGLKESMGEFSYYLARDKYDVNVVNKHMMDIVA